MTLDELFYLFENHDFNNNPTAAAVVGDFLIVERVIAGDYNKICIFRLNSVLKPVQLLAEYVPECPNPGEEERFEEILENIEGSIRRAHICAPANWKCDTLDFSVSLV